MSRAPYVWQTSETRHFFPKTDITQISFSCICLHFAIFAWNYFQRCVMLRCTHRCTCREWTTFSAVTSVNGYVLLRVGFNFDTFSLLARGNVRVKCGRSMRRLPAPPATGGQTSISCWWLSRYLLNYVLWLQYGSDSTWHVLYLFTCTRTVLRLV